MTLPALYTLADVCEALSMSDRWVRDQIKADNFPITRLGHKIRFTEEQYRTFVERHSTQQVTQSVTTGRKRR